MNSQFEQLTADVISRVVSGSNHREANLVHLVQKEVQFLAFSTVFNVQIPAFRYLPTEKNLKIWKLDKEVISMLMNIIKTRLDLLNFFQ